LRATQGEAAQAFDGESGGPEVFFHSGKRHVIEWFLRQGDARLHSYEVRGITTQIRH
jgi:hypothetical protein